MRSVSSVEADQHVSARLRPDPRPGKRSLEARILNAMAIVAQLLEADERYLPIFLRLEEELNCLQQRHEALRRAKAFVRSRR